MIKLQCIFKNRTEHAVYTTIWGANYAAYKILLLNSNIIKIHIVDTTTGELYHTYNRGDKFTHIPEENAIYFYEEKNPLMSR